MSQRTKRCNNYTPHNHGKSKSEIYGVHPHSLYVPNKRLRPHKACDNCSTLRQKCDWRNSSSKTCIRCEESEKACQKTFDFKRPNRSKTITHSEQAQILNELETVRRRIYDTIHNDHPAFGPEFVYVSRTILCDILKTADTIYGTISTRTTPIQDPCDEEAETNGTPRYSNNDDKFTKEYPYGQKVVTAVFPSDKMKWQVGCQYRNSDGSESVNENLNRNYTLKIDQQANWGHWKLILQKNDIGSRQYATYANQIVNDVINARNLCYMDYGVQSVEFVNYHYGTNPGEILNLIITFESEYAKNMFKHWYHEALELNKNNIARWHYP
jgi:hypothetical protein